MILVGVIFFIIIAIMIVYYTNISELDRRYRRLDVAFRQHLHEHNAPQGFEPVLSKAPGIYTETGELMFAGPVVPVELPQTDAAFAFSVADPTQNPDNTFAAVDRVITDCLDGTQSDTPA